MLVTLKTQLNIIRDAAQTLILNKSRFASTPGEDRRTSAARCLGELVRKMGERILTRIIPILRDGMSDPSPSTRQGVCLGLKEVLDNVSRHQLGDHLADVLTPVQAALCDVDAGVREAAGAAFGALFKVRLDLSASPVHGKIGQFLWYDTISKYGCAAMDRHTSSCLAWVNLPGHTTLQLRPLAVLIQFDEPRG